MTRAIGISAEQVAQILGCKEATFRNKRLQLEREHGFPPKLPGCNSWSLPAVEQWIRTNGATYLPALGETGLGGEPSIVIEAADRLSRDLQRSAA